MQPDRSFQSFASRYRQSSFTYDVKRDVYNEENFQQEHRKKTTSSVNVDIDIGTVGHQVQCRCVYAFSRSQAGSPQTLLAAFGAYFCFPLLDSCHQNP